MRELSGGTRRFLAVFAPLALLFLLTGQGNINKLSPDPVAAGVAAWSVAETGSLDVTGKDVPVNPWLLHWHGEVLSNRTPGVIAFGIPAAVVASRFTDAFSLWPERVTAALVSASAAGLLALLLVQLGASARGAAIFSLLAGVASGTWSVSSDALWTHGPDQLLLLAALLACARRHYWLAGVLLGCAETVRVHLVVVALCLGVGLAWTQRDPRRLWQLGLPAAAGLGVCLAYAHAVFGLWSLSPGYAAYGQPTASAVASTSFGSGDLVNVLGALFSPDRGVLVISPVVLVLLTRIVPAWKLAPTWARAAALGGLLYLGVQLRLNHFTGGVHFYGYRLTLESLTLLAPLLWLSWRSRERHSGWERAVQATLCLSIGSQLLGALWVTPDGLASEWRHTYVVDVFDPDLYPVICQVVVAVSLLAALLCILRRPRALRASAPEAQAALS
ncbi:MAG: hypothetical protein JWM02_364 [Frankiales bacterium]|nr:hypothetical protein [Frankiales bacterium]